MSDIKKKLQDDIAALEYELHVELPKEILKARAHGDLSENAEYHAAKEDQAHLETRIKRLRQRLRNAVVVESASGGDTLAFGRSAEIRDESNGETQTWTIVGPTEANRAEGKISAESPVARALLGRAAGELVDVQTPRGVRKLLIQRLL